MFKTFQSDLWQVAVPPPWKAEECEDCVEFTQPEGVGAFHISWARKNDGYALDAEALSELERNCPVGTETESVRCGDFKGYSAEYIDWNDATYWKKWFLACRKVLLFASYNCPRGEEELEAAQASELLSTLRCIE